MEIQLQLKLDNDKLAGYEYCKKAIETMKQLRQDMPPELLVHCKNTINRMCELAENLEVGWRAWVTNDFNQALQKHELLKNMTCCEQADLGYRFNHDD